MDYASEDDVRTIRVIVDGRFLTPRQEPETRPRFIAHREGLEHRLGVYADRFEIALQHLTHVQVINGLEGKDEHRLVRVDARDHVAQLLAYTPLFRFFLVK